MTFTVSDQDSDSRIFVLSAVGSILLHGLIMASLAYIPKTPVVQEDTLTVQVTLLPAQKVLDPVAPAEAAPAETPPHAQHPPPQPRTVMTTTSSLPQPQANMNRAQALTPPLQTMMRPTPQVAPTPLIPPISSQTILQDTRASQAMNARHMMKVRVPAQSQRPSLSLPPGSTRIHAASRVMAPISTVRGKPSLTRALPSLPRAATHRTLTATAPAHRGPMMTRPSIIVSPKPIYPRVAREAGWEGTVIVRTLIDTKGVPSQVGIRKSCGHVTLDQAAQDAVIKWKFEPAKDGNIPISKWVDIPIKFALNS